jgi:small GTP-binding protein
LKLVIAGDGGIGKTTLAKVFCNNDYMDQMMTIGIDIHSKIAVIDNEEFYIQIWDFSGQEQFRFLMNSFVQGAYGAILAFECSRLSSFKNLPEWINILRSENKELPIFLIATKLDIGYHPLIERGMILQFIKKYKMIGFEETSSKTEINIQVPFKKILENIFGLIPEKSEIIFKNKEKEI